MQARKASSLTEAEEGWEICAADPRYILSTASSLCISPLDFPAAVLLPERGLVWCFRSFADAQDDNALSSDPSLRLAASFRMTRQQLQDDKVTATSGMTKTLQFKMTRERPNDSGPSQIGQPRVHISRDRSRPRERLRQDGRANGELVRRVGAMRNSVRAFRQLFLAL